MNYAVIGVLGIVGAAALCAWAWEKAEHDVRAQRLRKDAQPCWPWPDYRNIRWLLAADNN